MRHTSKGSQPSGAAVFASDAARGVSFVLAIFSVISFVLRSAESGARSIHTPYCTTVTPVTVRRRHYTTGPLLVESAAVCYLTRHIVELSKVGGITAVSANDSASGSGLPCASSPGTCTFRRNGPTERMS